MAIQPVTEDRYYLGPGNGFVRRFTLLDQSGQPVNMVSTLHLYWYLREAENPQAIVFLYTTLTSPEFVKLPQTGSTLGQAELTIPSSAMSVLAPKTYLWELAYLDNTIPEFYQLYPRSPFLVEP